MSSVQLSGNKKTMRVSGGGTSTCSTTSGENPEVGTQNHITQSRNLKVSQCPPNRGKDDDQPTILPHEDSTYECPPLSIEATTYFNSFKPQAKLDHSLADVSISKQLYQLTSTRLSNASSLPANIASIPTAVTAFNVLKYLTNQSWDWVFLVVDVLNDLDAADNVFWAAASGRGMLRQFDISIGQIQNLITMHVTALDGLQRRDDFRKISNKEHKVLVEHMENILKCWEHNLKRNKKVKEQVELAMEWWELGNVLGDIELEIDSLNRLIFEMEERRHQTTLTESTARKHSATEMQELESFVEKAPKGEKLENDHLGLSSTLSAGLSASSPGVSNSQEDSSLLALYARMQPLRASLDFLPMTLSNYSVKADKVFPTACQELEERRKDLEGKWKGLQSDAELLRQELNEDRWIMVFRNAARQARKLCESIERSISKLQGSIDIREGHTNPAALAKKTTNYENKKAHYSPAVKKVLGIIEKGVKDRVTVNGEIIRLEQDTKARWMLIESQIKEMDLVLEYLNSNRSQHLQDSVSSVVSMDRSTMESSINTPRSSRSSSIVIGPTNGHRAETIRTIVNGIDQNMKSVPHAKDKPNLSRRNFSMPHPTGGTSRLPRKISASKPTASNPRSSRNHSTDSSSRNSSTSIPAPVSRKQGNASLPRTDKPRWNSSTKVERSSFGSRHTPPPRAAPVRISSMTFRLSSG